MAANSLSFNNIATILNSIVSQATGQAQIVPTTGADFITVAQTGLLAGYDNLMGAISQVLTRTLISNRPYYRKFQGLEADNLRWGNHVRKLNFADRAWQDSGRLPITNGVAVDDQKPVLDNVLQTNFYGQNDYEIQYTLYSNQLDVAFRGPDEFQAFIAGKLQNIADMREQKHEALARATIGNLITGIITIGNTNQLVHLLTEYNTLTGLNLTATTVMQPANYPAFMKWVYSRIAAISSMLTERTQIFHQNVAGKAIKRHTPMNYQRVYLYAPERYGIEARVLADTFHDNYLRFGYTETVNFWQAVDTPDSINMTPVYMKTDGTLDSPAQAVNQANVFGVIMDMEAAGYTVVNERSTKAAYNGEGEYQNFWFKFTDRYWNDFTENAVVLLLD